MLNLKKSQSHVLVQSQTNHERLDQDNVLILNKCSEIIRAVDIIGQAAMWLENALFL
ncbi:hypothetical protein LYNGBM3L_14660 [Moorena producens 3L]|uniref:Uncharacterized protein n=1 Tax=Moorena producens 3L TaxID=489825 RepID=F4XLG7_9CYAN|nr:hypothetical protein LYNGBM3L_14660 [Moorena producens 3L]